LRPKLRAGLLPAETGFQRRWMRAKEFWPDVKIGRTFTGCDQRPLTVEQEFSGWVSLLNRDQWSALMMRWRGPLTTLAICGTACGHGMNAHPRSPVALCDENPDPYLPSFPFHIPTIAFSILSLSRRE